MIRGALAGLGGTLAMLVVGSMAGVLIARSSGLDVDGVTGLLLATGMLATVFGAAVGVWLALRRGVAPFGRAALAGGGGAFSLWLVSGLLELGASGVGAAARTVGLGAVSALIGTALGGALSRSRSTSAP